MEHAEYRCPPPFYHNSRELKVLKRLKTELERQGLPPEELEKLMAVFRDEETAIIQSHIAQHRVELYQTFPGLTFFAPDHAEQSKGVTFTARREHAERIRRSSLLTGERQRFKRLRRLMREALKSLPSGLGSAEAKRRSTELQEMALFKTYGVQYGWDLDFQTFQRLTRKAIERTQGYVQQLLDYLPINHSRQLIFAAGVRNARDFPTLIALAAKSSGAGIISLRTAQEARVIAELALLELEHLIGAYNPDKVDAIRQELISVFEDQVFDPGQSRRLVVVAELDPANDYRVRRDGQGRPLLKVHDESQSEAHQTATSTRMVLPLDVRVIRYNGRSALVYFEERHKEMIFAKLLRKLYREPEHITDHSGLTCVVFDDESSEVLADKLRRTVVVNPGQVWAQMSNAARAGAIDSNNPHSAVDRRGEKYIFRWGGINHELQILDIASYVD